MRTWRVGTISMGLALLSLGIFLFVSQFFPFDLTKIMMAWWPLILVILGLEILLYLYFNRKEKPVLKYDFLSIIFVGIIGMTGILFAALSMTGLLDLAEEAVGREQRVYELPEYMEKIDDNIQRVVVDMAGYPLTVESTGEDNMYLFGTYSALTKMDKPLLEKPADYLAVQRKGDTLYVKVKTLPTSQGGPFDTHAHMEGTLLVPDSVQLEISGEWNELALKPRTLETDWRFDRFSEVTVHLPADSDIALSAKGAERLASDSGSWTINEKKVSSAETVESQEHGVAHADEYERSRISGEFKTGKGSHTLHMRDIRSVEVMVES